MSFPIRKIGMPKMPKIAMLSTKTMSFPILKIGMLKMPKIAMLSTAVYKLLQLVFVVFPYSFPLVVCNT